MNFNQRIVLISTVCISKTTKTTKPRTFLQDNLSFKKLREYVHHNDKLHGVELVGNDKNIRHP